MAKQFTDPKDPQFKPEYQDKEYRQEAEGLWYQVEVDCGCPGQCYCLETRWTRIKPADESLITDTENWPIPSRPSSWVDV